MGNKTKAQSNRFFALLSSCVALGLGILPALLQPKPALSAERIRIFAGPLEFSISIDSLETFAEEGEIRKDLAFYTNRLEEPTVQQLRQLLQKRFKISHVTLYRITHMPMAEALLRALGNVIQISNDLNGFYAIRSAVVGAAINSSEGWTIIDVMRSFPTKDIRINTNLVFEIVKELPTLSGYRQTAAAVIAEQADMRAASESPVDLSKLPDLRQPGPRGVIEKTLTFNISELRSTAKGLAGSYDLDVDIYLPEENSQPAPLVVMTHGFGSTRKSYDYMAQHLASHGLAVAAVEHLGSNLEYRNTSLRGELSHLLSPTEYTSRPLDVTHLLDELENLVETQPDWAARINLEQVGILGNSFGGTTVLSLAGATINEARLRQECTEGRFSLNPSLLLQCRASYLPPKEYDLREPRIKAAFAAYPVSSVLFGPEGMGSIEIPTLLMAGSNDIVMAPVIPEQIHPFVWLKAPEKYLALMIPGTHFSTSSDELTQRFVPKLLRGPDPSIGRSYIKALSVAFFYTHLANRSEYLPYLSASYAQAISQDEMELKVIKSLTAEQLEAAYNAPLPIPVIPETVLTSSPPPREESILEEIKRTGVLKVATRSDAAPFGYIDSTDNSWAGYCSDLADSFADYLTERLNSPAGIEVSKVQSTLENRFELVENDTVHLECGPNSIRRDLDGVLFSNPFFVTGTQFLVKTGNSESINPNETLEDLKTGVLRNSLTEIFLQQTYPRSKKVFFEGETGREEGIQALNTGTIEAFASDGILLLGEAIRQNLSLEDYTLVPKRPLTCDFYGLILPDNDGQWQKTVDSFLRDERASQAWEGTLLDSFPNLLLDIDYCLNR
ncbi:MAG: alpha/beta hydrolase [Symploca sp. SIO2E9]|nr:alpha/beta hydrolase [Symploca sp. SIO2E9]